jgi:hypothetical protein
MCNFLLVITWFPACIVLHHKSTCSQRCSRGHGAKHDEQSTRPARCAERVLAGPVHHAVAHDRAGPALFTVLMGAALAMGFTGASIERSSTTMLLLQDTHIASQCVLRAMVCI